MFKEWFLGNFFSINKLGFFGSILYIVMIIPIKMIYHAGANFFYNFGTIGSILSSFGN
jgi:hypothetical protein